MNAKAITVRAVIPHYFAESDGSVRKIGAGFGSRQPGGRLARCIAFSRCLHGLLNLRRSVQDLQLDLRTAASDSTPPALDSFELKLEVVVVVHQDDCLLEVIAPLVPQVKVLRRELDDPRQLGLEARDWLISHPSPADLNLYMEDDLVIHDPLFVEKILWMAFRSNHQCVLLPHRYELTRRLDLPARLLIDGPINHDDLAAWHCPSKSIATGNFRGQQGLQFDCPSNPHSGCFGISRQQLLVLRECELPYDGFVGPLETAATYTVGCAFLLLKPALENRSFLMVEHGHPSFLGYLELPSNDCSSGH
jgi:hypothetical protein